MIINALWKLIKRKIHLVWPVSSNRFFSSHGQELIFLFVHNIAFGSPLRPFITIAANDIKRNTKIFVPDLEGWEIPGSSKKHNGCLLVDGKSRKTKQ